jgi:hypothetical protein
MAEYVISGLSPEKFMAALNNLNRLILVAEHERGLVGCAVVKFGVPCPNSDHFLIELHTLYVQLSVKTLPAARSKKLFIR